MFQVHPITIDDDEDDEKVPEDLIVEFKSEYCLGGCCRGVIVKPFGLNTTRWKTISGILDTEQKAVDTAKSLMNEWNIPINEDTLLEVSTKIKAGETVLNNSEPPEVCQNCGVSLQLYRGNCAKCGKYLY